MSTFTLGKLSASTDGEPVLIAATATAGTTIHTGVSGTTSFDQLMVWLTNTDTVARTVTIEYGGTTAGFLIVKALTLPASSPPIPVLTGQIINNGSVVAVFASATNVVLASGYIITVVP